MCRQSLLLHAAMLVIFMGVLPEAIQCMPLSSDDDAVHGGLIAIPGGNEESSQCVNFTNHYCNQFENRNTAYFPNQRGHKTVAEANKEFQDFIPLLQSGCHPKLGTLLCFIYFPFCESSYPSVRIYPCKEVCQEVHNSSCTDLVNEYARGWNDQLQCEMPYFLPKLNSSGQCADGVAPHYPGSPTSAVVSTEVPSTEAPTKSDVDECADGTHDCDENADCINTDGSYTCTCKSGYSGDGRTCAAVCDESCPSECNYRNNANSKTFERNAYCYAARVTVKSREMQRCHNAFTVEVKSQFDIQTPFNSSHSTKAPSMGESAIILTGPCNSNDTDCPKLVIGETYLIAGAYSRAADGSVQWKLEGVNDKSLVSKWVSRYDRKFGNFVSGGNKHREMEENKHKFLQECEKNEGLVSADQWIRH